MPELLHPGVYVQEVPSTVRPIQAVSTSTAAFIGIADKGPLPGTVLPTGRAAQPVLVTSFTEYLRQFGGFRQDSFLTYAVQNFFDNGGRRLYIVRVADSTAQSATGTVTPPMQLQATHPGTWSNLLRYDITSVPPVPPSTTSDKFKLTVRAIGMASSDFLDQFTDLTMTSAQAAINASKYVQLAALTRFPPNGSNLTLGGGTDDSSATPATATLASTAGSITVNARYPGVWAQAANGNLTVSVEPATDTLATDFNLTVKLAGKVVEKFSNLTFIPASGPVPPNYGRTVVNARSQYITFPADFSARPTDVADAAFTGGSDGASGTQATGPGPIAISAVNKGAWGNKIKVTITGSSDNDPDNFKLGVWYDLIQVETFDRLTYQGSPTLQPNATNPAEYALTVVNSRSEYIAITKDFDAVPTKDGPPSLLQGGDDGPTGATIDYTGQSASNNTLSGTGLHALDKITDVNLIAIPGQGEPAVVNAGLDYCYNRPLQDCFFIGDVGTVDITSARRDDATPDVLKLGDVVAFATTGFGTPAVALDKNAGQYGAIYYPWIWATDPIGVGRNPRILLPPSGFMAGIYARIDNSRGVFKAPAGTEAGVSGALFLVSTVSDNEQDALNPINVNVIRTVPGSGIVVWGTRTIGSDASWRYIPVRRMAIFLRVSIYYGIQWAVFEPNDEPLWASLRLNIRSFMLTQFRAGAFQGSKPDDAFFVKCDSTTTTQQDIDNGVVNILVGFAPLKPAEFVVLKLSQKVNQPAL
jgi:uncharacterized protein